MILKFKNIDHGNEFDFGRTSAEYAKFRDIYPKALYEKLYNLGIGIENSSWLDIGTGTGVLPFNLYNYGGNITGVDISESQIEVANALAIEKGSKNVHFLVSPAETLPFPDNSFDSITAAQCFWYFDRESVTKEIKRVLKPGGVFAKIYMSYTLTDEIARKSHTLVKEMNTSWTPGASGSKDIYNHPFPNGNVETFECKIPFTRESWHGRMLACRGTMASMDEDTLKIWNEAHLNMLSEYPGSFEINHKVYIAWYIID